MNGNLRKSLARRFDDELRFLKGWIDKPKAVGAIVPTSGVTARKMASVVNPHSGLPVLELGPGTGPVTEALVARGVDPARLVLVEVNPVFCRLLRTRDRRCRQVNARRPPPARSEPQNVTTLTAPQVERAARREI